MASCAKGYANEGLFILTGLDNQSLKNIFLPERKFVKDQKRRKLWGDRGGNFSE